MGWLAEPIRGKSYQFMKSISAVPPGGRFSLAPELRAPPLISFIALRSRISIFGCFFSLVFGSSFSVAMIV